MHLHEQRVVYPIELDGLADGRIGDPRISHDRRLMAGDAVEPVESPYVGDAVDGSPGTRCRTTVEN